ncbi:MAG: TolC family protein [Gammaproteobacteria bacterium]|nr:TolC family protein [Gammaproteobacteria bacterium]
MRIAVLSGVRTAALLITLACGPLASADTPLRLDQAIAMALERDAGRAAELAEADAAAARAIAAAQLPDPELKLEARSVPVDSLALDREDMTMLGIGVAQRLPTRRGRELARSQLEHHAHHFSAAAALREREVGLAVARDWLELDFLDGALALLVEERDQAALQLETARAAYAAGEAEQSALLQARALLLDLDELRIDRQREREIASARLGRWLGAPAPAARIPGFTPAPDVAAEPESALDSHPALLVFEHETAAAATEVELARTRYRPALAVELGYGLRQGRDAAGRGRDDLLDAMLTIELPLFTRNRQDRELAAARAAARAAQARREQARRELSERFAIALAEIRRRREALALYDGEAHRLAAAAADAALAAYRSGAGGIDAVFAARRQALGLRQRELQLRYELDLAAAEIRYLTGAQP